MKQATYDWGNHNILDDVDFNEKDLKEFKNLLGVKEEKAEAFSLMRAGQLLFGTIVEINKEFAVIDVGLKSEGLVPIAEFADPEELAFGKRVEVLLDKTEGPDGQVVLSLEKARKHRRWEHILKSYKEGSIIEGTIVRKVKGGLMVDIGIEAFLPGSQIDNKRIKNLDDFVGKKYDFKILKINIERKNIVVSRRELLEAERASKRSELLENIKVGDLRKGIVKNITDFGVFLDLDGIDGLLHITDMTWRRIRHPSEMVKMGDDVEVMILSIDKEKGRVALGLKQKEQNPWEEIEKKFPQGTKVKGKITNLVSYGAFIELLPGIEGLIHVSEMSWTKTISDPSEMVNIGDEVEAIVLSIQKDEGKISLGMKQTERNPWEDIVANYPIGKIVEAEIRNLTNYGAFVELEPGVDGLIHISDLSWTKKVSHPSEMLKKGEKTKAQVLSVDKESKKITLGIKQLSENPWESIEKTMPLGSTVKGVVKKITAFGIFVQLENHVDGLIHINELSDQPIGKIEDIVSVGDPITARVLKIDTENKKISLSMKTEGKKDDIVVGKKRKKAPPKEK